MRHSPGRLPATSSDGTQSFVWYGLGLFAVTVAVIAGFLVLGVVVAFVATAARRSRQTRLA